LGVWPAAFAILFERVGLFVAARKGATLSTKEPLLK